MPLIAFILMFLSLINKEKKILCTRRTKIRKTNENWNDNIFFIIRKGKQAQTSKHLYWYFLSRNKTQKWRINPWITKIRKKPLQDRDETFSHHPRSRIWGVSTCWCLLSAVFLRVLSISLEIPRQEEDEVLLQALTRRWLRGTAVK